LPTLFKKGRHIADVGIQYNGEIAVGTGGDAGEYYLRIPEAQRPRLLSALAAAAGKNLSEKMKGEASDEALLFLFAQLFGNKTEDPYNDIKEFLSANNVHFKSDYWVGDR
jgi:hypothetical protein